MLIHKDMLEIQMISMISIHACVIVFKRYIY